MAAANRATVAISGAQSLEHAIITKSICCCYLNMKYRSTVSSACVVNAAVAERETRN
jgi:hypothetical protein